MTDRELRDWLARRLRRDLVPLKVWEHEEVQECVRAYREGRGPRGDIESAARRITRDARQIVRGLDAARPLPAATPLPPPPLTDTERARSAALGTLAAKVAAVGNDHYSDDVPRFRRDILGPHFPLTSEQASALIASPACRFFTLDQFREFGVPVVGHDATMPRAAWEPPEEEEWEPEGLRCTVTITVTPPGEVYRVERLVQGGEDDLRQLLSPAVSERPLFYWTGSVVSRLWALSERLAAAWGWEYSQAARFVLTGEAPPVTAISGSIHYRPGRAEINLTLAPWLSEATVLGAFRAARATVAERGLSLANVSARNWRIYRFVSERTDAARRRPSWPTLTKAWNAAHPNERADSYRNFRRDFHRAEDALFGPS